MTHMTLADAPVAEYHPTYAAPRKPGTSAVVYCEGNFGGIDGKTASAFTTVVTS
jgi:hypothetical protein